MSKTQTFIPLSTRTEVTTPIDLPSELTVTYEEIAEERNVVLLKTNQAYESALLTPQKYDTETQNTEYEIVDLQ